MKWRKESQEEEKSKWEGDGNEVNRSGDIFARGYFRDWDNFFSFIYAKTGSLRRNNRREWASTKSQRRRKETAEREAESSGLFG